MKHRNFGEIFKNAAGTVFLLAAAFFVCSTLVSMRAVLADPVAGVQYSETANAPQSPRAGTTAASPRGGRGNANAANNSARTGGAVATAPRTVAGRGTASRGTAGQTGTARTVVQRSGAGVARTASGGRTVAARTGMIGTVGTGTRVALRGDAIRASTGISTSNSYLAGKLYTGNYSNIIDSTTGLISADAYNNCLEGYYTCMDEICTVRNAAQRRCACAGRVKAFAEAEKKLESANEELIKVAGDLALLIATKGKDISAAFQLTEAEQVLNCVSWQEAYKQGTWTHGSEDSEAYKWCTSHGIYTNADTCAKPDYCKSTGTGSNNFGFDIDNLNSNSSDILASLKSWADAKDKTLTITENNSDALDMSFANMVNVVGGLSLNSNLANSQIKDSLAETWGYELFEYAHNNVCNRVLDSCFNGIYEACGTPSGGSANIRPCSNGSTVCPYNYNSYISVNTSSGDYQLNFVSPKSGTNSNSATCYGYTTTNGDPYQTLRGPVADARRSILQKYALDANADCDAYGEQLRTTAQNVGYQKVAAQQALQKKRLEFAQAEENAKVSDSVSAKTNFSTCLSEIIDCYTSNESQSGWSTTRIKTYCAQVANIPTCYEQMVCNPSNSIIAAVIDVVDSTNCADDVANKTSTCRNVVHLNEILNGVAKGTYATSPAAGDSAQLREACLKQAGVEDVRNWCKPPANASAYTDKCVATACNSGYNLSNGVCVSQ
ncbi:MAG: hypothetical protein LBJ18_04395 [Rickettsiales bacterium]|jgi:hypothetical protein|nr:hypothetical protein [Rickettsiales bacterium]